MAEWKVTPEWKKSIIERNYYHKDGNTVMIETGWRGGEFIVYTDDDNPPEIEAGVDMYNCDYETEMVETFDGCWEEHDMDDCDDEVREWLEEFFEENSWLDLEEHGWVQGDSEMIIDCDLIIERIDGDTPETVEIAPELAPIIETAKIKIADTPAKWPFPNSRPLEGPAVVEEKNKEPEVTEWFPIEIDPVHEGFYECNITFDENSWPYPDIKKLEWCNNTWWDSDSNVVDPSEIKQWRGLVKNPRAN